MTDSSEVDAWDESQHWVAEADRYDGQLAPFAEFVLERAVLGGGDVVLDVGCGCGATTIEAARVCTSAVGVRCLSRCACCRSPASRGCTRRERR